MKKYAITVFGLSLVALLTGCITVAEYSFSFDYTTGKVEREYSDLASRKSPDEKNYSVESDWKGLKELVEDKDPEFDTGVVQEVSKDLFQEESVLSARKVQTVVCPQCFPSKAAVLAYLHEDQWRFEMINDEIFLFLPGGNKIVSTNGKAVVTEGNSIIIWPAGTTSFSYVATEGSAGGTSLLPYYLEEKAKEK